MTTFFRLLHEQDKGAVLLAAVRGERAGFSFDVDPAKFAQVPGSPFAYWVSDRIRRLFKELPPFESEGRTVRVGLQTGDDFRFVRCWWEVQSAAILDGGHGPDWRSDLPAFQAWCKQRTFEGKRWAPFAKGGEYSPFYADLHLVVNWERDGEEMKAFEGSVIRNPDYYFRPGLTFGRRIRTLAPAALPTGSIFSDSAPSIFCSAENFSELSELLMLLNSPDLQGLFATLIPERKMEVGYLRQLPLPKHRINQSATLKSTFARCFYQKITTETAWAFTHYFDAAHREDGNSSNGLNSVAYLDSGLNEQDFTLLRAAVYHSAEGTSDDDDAEGMPTERSTGEQKRSCSCKVACQASYAVGVVFGRWDVRYATGERTTPPLPDPFDPLPVSSPGMLQGEDGLPLSAAPAGYPVTIAWPGILPDDPDHPDDIVRRVQEVYDLLKLTCDVPRDYFRKPGKGGFWDDHVSRYSKSRRKAPIYWLLQSSRKNYALWVYYPRLDRDRLFKALVNYVEPKIRLESSRLESLRGNLKAAGEAARDMKQAGRDVERQDDLLSELRDFEAKLRRAADLRIEPDFNDGVVLNIAPLHELSPWKEAKNYWEDLLAGKYAWSSIADQLRRKGRVK